MNKPIFEVSESAMHASWQDLGRQGSCQHGVTEGGVMDIQAAMWANNLLGRNVGEPLIEISVGMFEVVFRANCQIAITGADLDASLDDRPITPWSSFLVCPGTRLKFATPRNGLRAYLAIDALFNLQTYFGSVSTVVRENLGGFKDRILQAGDTITGIAGRGSVLNRTVPGRYIPDYQAPLTLELISGYQFDQFPKTSIENLLKTEYQIQNSSSRMACILQGEPISHDIQSLLSEGIAYGAVQVPPDGQPVILLSDRQTMGGYPKVGCISRLSAAALAQRLPSARIRFKTQCPETTRQDYLQHLAFFSQ